MRLISVPLPSVLGVVVLANAALAAQPMRFGADALVRNDPRSYFSRSVNFSPASGQHCDLNPPRFRWQYNPTTPGAGGNYLFHFQVAADPQFKKPLIDVTTPFNFYNTVAPLPGPGLYYSRITYKDLLDKEARFPLGPL